MKKTFKIWDEKCKEISSDDYCYLRLTPSDAHEALVNLCAVDAAGEAIKGGTILVLDSYVNIIVVLESISDEIPLKTDLVNVPLVYTEDDIRRVRSRELVGIDITRMMKKHFEENHSDEAATKQTIN